MNATPQELFDLATYSYSDLINMTVIKFSSLIDGEMDYVELANMSSNMHEIVEQRTQGHGKCWTLTLLKRATDLGIRKIKFTL